MNPGLERHTEHTYISLVGPQKASQRWGQGCWPGGMRVRGQEETACAQSRLRQLQGVAGGWERLISLGPPRSADGAGASCKLSIPSGQMFPPAPSLPRAPNNLIRKPRKEIPSPEPGLLDTVFAALRGSPAGPLPSEARRRRSAPASELCLAVSGRELSDTAGASSLQTIPYFNGASPPKLII